MYIDARKRKTMTGTHISRFRVEVRFVIRSTSRINTAMNGVYTYFLLHHRGTKAQSFFHCLLFTTEAQRHKGFSSIFLSSWLILILCVSVPSWFNLFFHSFFYKYPFTKRLNPSFKRTTLKLIKKPSHLSASFK